MKATLTLIVWATWAWIVLATKLADMVGDYLLKGI